MEKVFEFLRTNAPFYVATIDGDSARVRPFGFIMMFEDRIYFGLGDHKKVYQQMVANPKIEISSTDKESRWLRLSGKVVFDSRPEAVEAAWKAAPSLKEMYQVNHWNFLPFYLENAVAVFADMAGNSETITF